MTRPYSLDLRQRIVRAVEAGASRRATAAQLEVSLSCVVKLVQPWRRNGTPAPDPVGGGRRAKLAGHAELVHALLAATSPPPGAPGVQRRDLGHHRDDPPLRGARRGRRVVAAVPHGDLREAIAATGARLLYPPTLWPGSEPDRARLRQAQGAAAHRRRHPPGPVPCRQGTREVELVTPDSRGAEE
jgi:hypothetical protein